MRFRRKSSILDSFKYLIVVLLVGLRNSGNALEAFTIFFLRDQLSFDP